MNALESNKRLLFLSVGKQFAGLYNELKHMGNIRVEIQHDQALY
jgi:hypothetical protein